MITGFRVLWCEEGLNNYFNSCHWLSLVPYIAIFFNKSAGDSLQCISPFCILFCYWFCGVMLLSDSTLVVLHLSTYSSFPYFIHNVSTWLWRIFFYISILLKILSHNISNNFQKIEKEIWGFWNVDIQKYRFHFMCIKTLHKDVLGQTIVEFLIIIIHSFS